MGFPDVYPKFGSALARDPNVQDEYRNMLGGSMDAIHNGDQHAGAASGSGISPVNRGGRWDANRAKQSDTVAQRESQILRLPRASNDSMQMELDRLKEQSKQQRL